MGCGFSWAMEGFGTNRLWLHSESAKCTDCSRGVVTLMWYEAPS